MPGFDRILAAYEHGMQKLADELVAELDPTDEERGHLLLASQLAQAVVRAYDSFQLDRGPALDATKSVMYAAANQPDRRVLNVPLRTLVDNNTLTGVEARLLSGSLNMQADDNRERRAERGQIDLAQRAHRHASPRPAPRGRRRRRRRVPGAPGPLVRGAAHGQERHSGPGHRSSARPPT